MKANLFISSSVEGLPIANAIQQNLERDCNPTVWDQGIFQLSSSALDGLLAALKTHQFAIFVFTPDDVVKIRENTTLVARDNIVFEFGLFFGGLGKERVYYIKPRNVDLHIPTDLLGINSGSYDPDREDQNLQAALGPFCNQVREKLKAFLYESLDDLQNETKEVKRLAVERPKFWEYLFLAELIETRLKPLEQDYLDLEKGSVFQQTVIMDFDDSKKFMLASFKDIMKLIEWMGNLVTKEIKEAMGPPGVTAKVFDMKKTADNFLKASKELLAWEYRLQGLEVVEDFKEILEIMKGWTSVYFKMLFSIPRHYKEAIKMQIEGTLPEGYKADLSIPLPPGLEKVTEILRVLTSQND